MKALDYIKNNCDRYADLYLKFDWKNINKNDLFRGYLKQSDEEIKAAYLSAIISRYWNNLYKLHFKSPNVATWEDCYTWIVDAALYTLKKHKWDDPTSSIYNDPKGPDKVMNRMLKSFRLGHYEKTNADKRKLNATLLSIEGLTEELRDSILPTVEDRDISEIEDSALNLIKENFERKNYFTSFLAYILITQENLVMKKDNVNENGEKDNKYNLDLRKINYLIRHIDERQCRVFSDFFKLDLEEVLKAANICKELTPSIINKAIKRNLSLILRDENISPNDNNN